MKAQGSDQFASPEFAARSARFATSRDAVVTQRSFLPPPVHDGRFVHAAAATYPCHAIGGDFFDYLDSGEEFHAVVGDACGKGTPAALQAALAQGIVAADLEAGAGAASLVARLNRRLCRRGIADRFVTLFYGVIARDGRLTYCNAGQCRPMLVTRSSVRRLTAGGPPAGIFCDAQYREESCAIEPGDALVVFSDGLQEACDGRREFGDGRIQQIVTECRDRTASAVLRRLVEGVRTFTHGRLRDDVTVLVAKYVA